MFSSSGCNIFECVQIQPTNTTFYPCMRHCHLIVDDVKADPTCAVDCHEHGNSTVLLYSFFFIFFFFLIVKFLDWSMWYSFLFESNSFGESFMPFESGRFVLRVLHSGREWKLGCVCGTMPRRNGRGVDALFYLIHQIKIKYFLLNYK
jgi:hypothetical protein